jgi:phosphoenolpyruvate carboxykinase (GTP)
LSHSFCPSCHLPALAHSVESPIGLIPAPGAIDVAGLTLKDEAMTDLFRVSKTEWTQEVSRVREFHSTFGDRMPQGIKDELATLEKRISALPL